MIFTQIDLRDNEKKNLVGYRPYTGTTNPKSKLQTKNPAPTFLRARLPLMDEIYIS